ncbi:MAG: energy transducer TonB [Candidatus Omnitrophota bacterium]
MRNRSENNITALAFIAALCFHGFILGAPADIFSFLEKVPPKEELILEINIEKPELLPEIKKIAEQKVIKEKRVEPEETIKTPEEVVMPDEEKPEEKVESEDPDIEEMFRYKDAIRQRIESCRIYPRSARNNRIEGTSTVTFVVLADGTLRDIQLKRSSGYRMLDDEALKTIKRAGSFPPIPDSIKTDSIPMEVSMVFSLK